MLDERCIFVNTDCATSEEVLNYMGSRLYQLGYVKESFTKAVIERESMYATGLDTEEIKTAIPHTDSVHVNETTIAVMTLRKPVLFESMDQDGAMLHVEVVFMLAIREPEKQLEMLGAVLNIIQDKQLLYALRHAADAKEVVKRLTDKISESR